MANMPSAGALMLPPVPALPSIAVDIPPLPRPPDLPIATVELAPRAVPGRQRGPLPAPQQVMRALNNSIPAGTRLREVRANFDNYTGTVTVTATMNNDQIWTEWQNDYAVTLGLTNTLGTSYTATTSAACEQLIWSSWNTQYEATGSSTTTAVGLYNTWGAWNDTYEDLQDLRTAVGPSVVQRYARRNLSEAELKAELEREKKYRADAEAAKVKAELAKTRAEQLLMGNLSEEQKNDLKTKGSFYISIPHENGKTERYRIDKGSHGNVYQVDAKGSIIRSFCIQPSGVPLGDILLTQKLFIEADDQTRSKFWEIANITERAEAAKHIPHTIPRSQRYQYAKQHGLLH